MARINERRPVVVGTTSGGMVAGRPAFFLQDCKPYLGSDLPGSSPAGATYDTPNPYGGTTWILTKQSRPTRWVA